MSAGGTREALDPVRYLGNRSSGKQGVALARAAAHRGAHVTLVAASVEVPLPTAAEGVDVVRVESALELEAAVHERAPEHDAVGDLGRGVDDGGRVDGHWAGSATVTTMAMNSASAASLPSIKVSPRNL